MKHLKYFVVAFVVMFVGMYALVQTANASYDPIQAGTTDVAYQGGGVCSDGSTPVSTTWDFEDGAEGWTTDFVLHSGDLTATFALTTSNAPGSTGNSPSGGNRFYAEDFDGAEGGDAYLLSQYLVSPEFGVPTGGGAVMSFWDLQAFEISDIECWDSGLLEVSSDGGATWERQYNGQTAPFTVTPAYDLPIHIEYDADLPEYAGALAWCSADPDPNGNGWGWEDWSQRTVDLSSYAGETVQVRYRMFVDNLSGAYGWLVDDVQANVCPPEAPTAVTTSSFDSSASLPIVPMVGAALLGLVAVGALVRRARR